MQKGLDHFYAMRFHLKLPPLHALAIHSVCCDHKRSYAETLRIPADRLCQRKQDQHSHQSVLEAP